MFIYFKTHTSYIAVKQLTQVQQLTARAPTLNANMTIDLRIMTSVMLITELANTNYKIRLF